MYILGDENQHRTPRLQKALSLAREEAGRLNHEFVGTEHLLLGLIKLGQGTAWNVLASLKVDTDHVCKEVEKHFGTFPDQKFTGNKPFTPRSKKVLALAKKEAEALGYTFVGTEHLLLGFLREGDGVAGRVLKSSGLNFELVRKQVCRELNLGENLTTKLLEVDRIKNTFIEECLALMGQTSNHLSPKTAESLAHLRIQVLGELKMRKDEVAESLREDIVRYLCVFAFEVQKLEFLIVCHATMMEFAPVVHGQKLDYLLVDLYERLEKSTPDSREERNIGSLIQLITGKPVYRVLPQEMDYLSRWEEKPNPES